MFGLICPEQAPPDFKEARQILQWNSAELSSRNSTQYGSHGAMCLPESQRVINRSIHSRTGAVTTSRSGLLYLASSISTVARNSGSSFTSRHIVSNMASTHA